MVLTVLREDWRVVLIEILEGIGNCIRKCKAEGFNARFAPAAVWRIFNKKCNNSAVGLATRQCLQTVLLCRRKGKSEGSCEARFTACISKQTFPEKQKRVLTFDNLSMTGECTDFQTDLKFMQNGKMNEATLSYPPFAHPYVPCRCN